MKNKILSLLLVACLMLTFTASAYASNDTVSAQTSAITKDFSLNEVNITELIDLSASYIGSNKSLGFDVIVDQSNASFVVGVYDNETSKIIDFKNCKGSAFNQTFENVFEEGKSYRIFIGNWAFQSDVSGSLTFFTY